MNFSINKILKFAKNLSKMQLELNQNIFPESNTD